MTPVELEDDAARPLAPAYPGLTRAECLHGRRLTLIHDMYRKELSGVAALMIRIRDGGISPTRLAKAVGGMKMGRNLDLFGNLCGRQCALLQNHHDIEEQWMFPDLSAKADPVLQGVIDRLIAEHGVIHDLIGTLRQAAQDLLHDPSAFRSCADAFAALERAIGSHFGYEETQLADALGALHVEI